MVALDFGLVLLLLLSFGPLFEGVATVSEVRPVVIIRLVGLKRFFKHDSCKFMKLSFFGCEGGEPLVNKRKCLFLRRHDGGSTDGRQGNFRSTFSPHHQQMEAVKDDRLLHLTSVDEMFAVLREKGRGLASFRKGDTIYVWNRMQKKYSYVLKEEPGTRFAEGFTPFADPGEILALGAFGGKYLNDCLLEFPAEWFYRAGMLGKLSPAKTDVSLNYFEIDSRLPLSEWRKAGWVPSKGKGLKGRSIRSILSDPTKNPDERGWFQWYCRYWMGRRIPELDAVQIQRWKNFRRHHGAVVKNCAKGDLLCRPRQRQALLHWAWPFGL